MNIVNSIKGWFSQRLKSISIFFGGYAGELFTSRGPSEETIKNLFSIVYKCVDKRASEVASAKVYIKQQDDKVIERHPVLDLLASPNSHMTGSEFLYFLQAYVDVMGEVFIFIDREGARIGAKALIPLRPDKVSIELNSEGEIAAYVFRTAAGDISYLPEQIIHIKRPNLLNPIRGQSLIMAAAYEVDEHKLMHQSRIGLLNNDSIPPYYITPRGETGNLTDGQMERVEARIRDKQQGPHKRGNVLILPGALEAKALPVSHADLFYLKEIEATKTDVAVMFGVPLALLGDIQDFNRANAEAARVIFLSETCEHESNRIAQGLSRKLLEMYRITGGEIVFDLQIPEDRILKKDEAIGLTAAGIITINEARESLGYQPFTALPAADQLMGSALRVPIGTDFTRPILPERAGGHGRIKSLYPTPELADRKIKAFTRKQLAFERTVKRTMDDFFDSQSAKVRANLRKSYRKDAVSPAVEIYMPDVFEEGVRLALALSPELRAILESFAADEADALGATFVPDGNTAIETWLGEQLTERMTRINQTTADGLLNVLREGVQEHESIDKISQRVADYFGEQKSFRSERIARTEVIGASNRGNFAAIEAAGVDYKEWLTAEDDRVRDTHIDVNRTVLPRNDYFQVGTAQLLHPGDMLSGAPEEVINCRCVLVSAFPEEN